MLQMEELIVKYLNKSATTEEIETLSKWVKKAKNRALFKQYIEANHIANSALNELDTKQFEKELLVKIRKDKSINYKLKMAEILKYAAIFIVLVGGSYFITSRMVESDELIISYEDILLKHEDGNTHIISGKGGKNIVDTKGNIIANQQGNTINYSITNQDLTKGNNNEKQELLYNEIKIPYGKIFTLVLSDGTSLHLNAGTTMRYPIKFIEGEERKVFLLEGEAFFKVAKEEGHPFIVATNGVNIRVTGTSFNVSSYKEDTSINTVLVEGEVRLYNKNERYKEERSITLVPGELGAWNRDQKEINISKVDTSLYTGWMDKTLIFKHMKFRDIVTKLERNFNVIIKNNNTELDNATFTARFENTSIEHVLKSFKKNHQIDYTIKDNQIIIN
jgi:hypothetical protein